MLYGVCLYGCAPAFLQHEDYVKKSASLEQTGDISAAIEELKIALTIDPSNTTAQDKLKKLYAVRDIEVDKHYKAGLALKENDSQAATKEFLTALRINPDFQSAIDELKSQHLAFAESKLRSRTHARGEESRKKGEETESVTEESSHIGLAISLYENGEYQAAINELLKARAKNPKNAEIIKYLNLSYYNLGVYHYNNRDYMRALRTFTKVKRGFGHTDMYIKKTRVMLKSLADEFYRAGLKFYREQKLNEAIVKWNTVLDIEPDHQKAKEYILKSKKLLQALKK
jgi:tetratricopeptide (TPR) repeat protein